jgi:UPF0716 protein FxsA
MWKWGTLFLIVPVLELFLLLQLGQLLGVWATISIIFLTAMLGAYFTRQQGLGVLRSIQQSMVEGRMPTTEIVDGLCILIAGAFLLTPGFLTDILGFSLLIPPLRRRVQSYLRRRFERSMQDRMIEIEYGGPIEDAEYDHVDREYLQ